MQEQKRYDAVIVAGEEAASRRVMRQHKALLKIHGKPFIHYVINALQRVEAVREIYIVGPERMLRAALKPCEQNLIGDKQIHFVEQIGNLYENVWRAFMASLPEASENRTRHEDKTLLIVPCDAPLLTAKELEFFISRCDMQRYDYVLGLTPEKSLKYFYPAAGRPGIQMSYLHLKEKNYRINNLHMVKPVKVKNRDHINRMYAHRYQKRLLNILQLGLYVIRTGGFRSYRLLIALQLALKCAEWRFEKLRRFFCRRAPKRDLERAISRLLNTRFAGLEVPYPGAALDVDNDGDFQALEIMFDEWRAHLENMA